VLIDTPGLHRNATRRLNQYMNRAALGSLDEADVLLWVIDATRWSDEDEAVLERVRQSGRPALVAVNKVDRVRPKERLLPLLERLQQAHAFQAMVPISALKADNLDALKGAIAAALPVQEPLYPEDQVTDRSERFLVAEIIREKLISGLNEEVPYGLTVEIEQWEMTEDGRIAINAVVWVERLGQKKIVIGEGGERLKSAGRAARLEINELLGQRTHLELWVKVREDWADSEGALRTLGYDSA